MLPTVSSLMYDDALNAAQYGFAFLITRGGLVPVLRVDVVGRIAEVLERGGEELVRAVEHGDAALDLLQVLRIEDHRPRVGRQAELLHLLVVVADDRRRHRVRHRILVARIERRVEVERVDVLEVGQLRLVDRLQLAALDQRLAPRSTSAPGCRSPWRRRRAWRAAPRCPSSRSARPRTCRAPRSA